MATHFNLVSPRQDRSGKTRWHKVGAAFPRDKGGFSLVLDSLPLPDAEGRVSLLMTEPLPDEGGQGRQGGGGDGYGGRPSSRSAIDDDIPFCPEVRA